MASVLSMCCRRAIGSFTRFNSVNLYRLTPSSVFSRTLSTGTDANLKNNTTQAEPLHQQQQQSSSASGDAKTSATSSNLEEEKKKILAQLEELQDKYKRSLAETENVRQRLQKQIQDAKLFGIQGFCKDLLEVADVLNKATGSVSKEELNSGNPSLKILFEGLQMTESQLVKVFTKHGLEKINPSEGEKFDPNFHEALFQQPLPEGQAKVPGTVSIVSKIGYKLHNRTLRPALVGVFGSS